MIYPQDLDLFNENMMKFCLPTRVSQEAYTFLGSQVETNGKTNLDMMETLESISVPVLLLYLLLFLITWMLIITSNRLLIRRRKRRKVFSRKLPFKLLATAFNQNATRLRNSSSQRLAYFCFLMANFYLITYYYNLMRTEQVYTKPPKVINTLEDFYNAKDHFPVFIKGRGVISRFKESKDPVWREIHSRCKSNSILESNKIDQIIETVVKEKGVTIMNAIGQAIFERFYCQSREQSLYHKGSQKFARTLRATLRRKGLSKELVKRLEFVASGELESGLRYYWDFKSADKIAPLSSIDVCINTKGYGGENLYGEIDNLLIKSLAYNFSALSGGLLAAAVFVLIEIASFKKNGKRRRRLR